MKAFLFDSFVKTLLLLVIILPIAMLLGRPLPQFQYTLLIAAGLYPLVVGLRVLYEIRKRS